MGNRRFLIRIKGASLPVRSLWRNSGLMVFWSAWMGGDGVWIMPRWSVSGGRWNMRTSKSKSTSVCRSSASASNIMWIFTTPGGFIRLSNIERRMKSISELVIGKQWDIVTQRLLHQSFNKMLSNLGVRRKQMYLELKIMEIFYLQPQR